MGESRSDLGSNGEGMFREAVEFLVEYLGWWKVLPGQLEPDDP